MAAVLAVGGLLGYLAASGRLSPVARACAGQLLAPAESSSGAAPQPTTQTVPAQTPSAPPADKRPRNIIFVICDQETYHLTARDDYKLPARGTLVRRGVTFRNHYIASAMCSASRAAFLTGQPPQVNGVFDQMQYSYQHSLSPDRPNIGSVLKRLGYQTAYFGKFEMDKELLAIRDTVNYHAALQPYGFDEFGATGDVPSGPRDGYTNGCSIAGDGVRWLRTNVPKSRQSGRPFFLVLSFLNPHDIMFANANVPGMAPVQKPASPVFMPPLPANALYEHLKSAIPR
jgi:arylsulfatase